MVVVHTEEEGLVEATSTVHVGARVMSCREGSIRQFFAEVLWVFSGKVTSLVTSLVNKLSGFQIELIGFGLFIWVILLVIHLSYLLSQVTCL